MNLYLSPPRKTLLLAPSGSLKERTINITKDYPFEPSPRDNETEIIVSKKTQEFGFSVRKPPPDIKWTPNTKTKKKKSKRRQQQNDEKCVEHPIRDGIKVRFKTDKNGNIKPKNAEVPPNHYLTKEDIANNWWTKTELAEIKETANKLCRVYLKERSDYKNAVIRLLMRCGAQSTTNNEFLDISTEFENIELEDEENDVSTIVDGDTRGLEKRIILSMLLPFHRHKRSIHSLLDSQKRLWGIDPSYFTNDQRVRLLATQYALNAAYATKWSHTIALGDARGVNRNFKFDW